ncbi:GNAT family N-acetyltransferase [Alphaproteobacteria bacterium]|nr:GNAT family N-acetyltransferase [Alphaproteobacteria bacterium]
MKIELIRNGKTEVARSILQTLPDWFGIPESLEEYVVDAASQPMLACVLAEQTVGFLTLEKHNELNTEIAAFGALPNFHRRGIGRQLIAAAEDQVGLNSYSINQVCANGPMHC